MDLQAASQPSASQQYVSGMANRICRGKFGFLYRKVETGKGKEQFGCSTAVNGPPLLSGNQSSVQQPRACPVHINLSQQASITGRAQEPISRPTTTGQVAITGRAAISSPVLVTGQIPVVGDEADLSVLSISSDSVTTEEGGSSQTAHSPKTHPTCMGAEVERDTEVQTFTSQLTKICSGGKQAGTIIAWVDGDLPKLLEKYYKEFIYRKRESFSVPDSNSMIQDLQERIDRLRPTIELYQQELQAWDEVTEQKRLGVEDAKKTFESERDVDFSQLHCDDVETLKSYLTTEQASILEQPLLIKPLFMQGQLDTIGSKLDTELTRIHDHCHQVHSSLKLSSNFDASTVEDTPRTLFIALKQHC